MGWEGAMDQGVSEVLQAANTYTGKAPSKRARHSQPSASAATASGALLPFLDNYWAIALLARVKVMTYTQGWLLVGKHVAFPHHSPYLRRGIGPPQVMTGPDGVRRASQLHSASRECGIQLGSTALVVLGLEAERASDARAEVALTRRNLRLAASLRKAKTQPFELDSSSCLAETTCRGLRYATSAGRAASTYLVTPRNSRGTWPCCTFAAPSQPEGLTVPVKEPSHGRSGIQKLSTLKVREGTIIALTFP